MQKMEFKHNSFVGVIILLSFTWLGCARANTGKQTTLKTIQQSENSMENKINDKPTGTGGTEIATFGAGCFWCVEAQFQQLKGVKDVTSGYTGGFVKNPTYEQVCSGETGHAEVANIEFYPDSISYDKLLEAFFFAHDPTQLNRQGNDVGTQYRSAIYYHSDQQKQTAQTVITGLNEAGVYPKPIVTEVSPYDKFYKAEDYHKNYYKLNPTNPYCQMVVKPKADKFKKVFEDLVRK